MLSPTAFCELRRLPAGAEDVPSLVSPRLPEGDYRRILIKPNWVLHERDPEHPIAALVTSSEVLDGILEACLEKYRNAEEVTVGDVPVQTCDWGALVAQAGIARLIEKFGRYEHPRIRFLDLRREVFRSSGGFMESVSGGGNGDPRGYREIDLGDESFLEEVSQEGTGFRVSDYDPALTAENQRRGRHRYLVAGSVLDAELFVNVPKLKTHRMAGLTGALKNVVGINGQKANLVHFRRGPRSLGGDEFPPNVRRLILLQARLREATQKRYRVGFRLLRLGWLVLRRAAGIRTLSTRENLGAEFYSAPGAWYGNETLWRMIYDLNRAVRFASREGGPLAAAPQRDCLCVLDGLIAGEGNGPMHPLPVPFGLLGVSNDPALLDLAAARTMGFDTAKIPALRESALLQGVFSSPFDPSSVRIELDGEVFAGIQSLPVLRPFLPAPGWRGHIELESAAQPGTR